MRLAVLDRSRGAEWQPRFGEADPAFDGVREIARRFAALTRWPSVAEIDEVLRDRTPVRFVAAAPTPRGRRRRAPIDASQLYDGRITLEGVVPTRERSWHDLLNAIVWARVPRAKLAIHRAQYEAARARLGGAVLRIPGTRSRREDVLAMLDEGGVVSHRGGEVVIGHALLEHRIVSPEARPSGMRVELDVASSELDEALRKWVRAGATDAAS